MMAQQQLTFCPSIGQLTVRTFPIMSARLLRMPPTAKKMRGSDFPAAFMR